MDVKKFFTYNSSRAQKARLAIVLKSWVIWLSITAVILLLAGVGLLIIGWAVGWAIVGLGIVPAMITGWYDGELKRLPISKKGERVDDYLEKDILGRLPSQPSPYDIATTISHTVSGQFFAVRLGVSGGFLEQVTSKNRDDTTKLWQEVLAVRQQLETTTISSGVIIIALLRQLPTTNRDSLLGHLQLDEQDLLAGVRWYDRAQQLVSLNGDGQRRPGGIGRDWSFGWIPTLSRFGRNISESVTGNGLNLVQTASHQEAIAQLATTLDSGGQRNAVIVGKPGSGKTELVYAFAEQLMNPAIKDFESLRFHQVFLLDATALIAQASGKGELENLLENLFSEALTAKNIIICLDEAQLFFEEGVGSVDLTNLLLPILEAGRLPIILTMDEQRYLEITKRAPALKTSINRINLQPTSQTETLQVMQDQLVMLEYRAKVTYMYQALKETYHLSERYVYDQAMPGRALQLLETAASYAEDGLITARSVEQAIEKTMSVKVGKAHDSSEKEKLLDLENLIHKRMVNQTRAVGVVSDALRRARAGVRNQDRPIGTFLFLGPTGVGKTELAKALAAVYFNGEDNIVRLDMNEFVSASDVQRLIADGAEDAGSLTAQIMKRPFSVVLLDEIEKAHSSVLTTLLQLLDEGILRDVNGRDVSFRDAIIIATSNAGAERIREYIDRGYSLDQFEDQFVDELISSDVFHPEFLNRFDEIVVFSPLSKDDLMKVVDLILADVNKTLSSQKVSVTVSDEAKRYLVDSGYDPRLGARPMRRVVQKAVENTVAKQMLSGEVEAGSTVEIGLEQVQALVSVKKHADKIVKESADDATDR